MAHPSWGPTSSAFASTPHSASLSSESPPPTPLYNPSGLSSSVHNGSGDRPVAGSKPIRPRYDDAPQSSSSSRPSSVFEDKRGRRRRSSENLKVDTAESSPQHRISPSPSFGRSPAANFLSAFSSMNSMVEPTSARDYGSSSIDGRSSSSGPDELKRLNTNTQEAKQSPSNWSKLPNLTTSPTAATSLRGLGGVASQLMHKREASSGELEIKGFNPEEEGSTFGPDGRYQLGKVVGFGGFSTIREGWDLSEEQKAGRKKKVAVKLVYRDAPTSPSLDDSTNDEQELSIWRSLPSHPNLLPLLYDDTMLIDRPDLTSSTGSLKQDGSSTQQQLQLLVMPLCEGGNLMDFVRGEGGRRQAPSRVQSTSLARSRSLNKPSEDAQAQTRTGSGFITHRSPAASTNVTPSSSLAMARSPSGAGISRRTSSAIPRSQGVDLRSARDILRQLAEGLYCLHSKMNVLHGDLKLENVLAQRMYSSNGSAAGGETGSAPAVCWRLADFGLSQRVDVEGSRTPQCLPFFKNRGAGLPSYDSATSRQGAALPPARSLSRIASRAGGGSLAYTPPEVWRDGPAASSPAVDAQEDISPFASDMWALGCIAYALLSGRMPFSDAFEPRLQAKIAKGEWEVPPRLWRRARRLASEASMKSEGGALSRQVSGKSFDRTGSFGSGSASASRDQQPGSLRSSFSPSRPPSLVQFTAINDLSASLPSLPDAGYKTARYTNHDLAAAHDAPVVGSVPTKPGEPHRFDIDTIAQAAADAEADPESDEEISIDQQWDGTSTERAAARAVLRGLLEPEPAKRWTVQQLLACRWLAPSPTDERHNPFASNGAGDRRLDNLTEGVAVGASAADEEAARQKKPERPQWGREKSWRTEITFERQEPDREALRGRRPSSLSRSRPPRGDEDGRRSRSVSVTREGNLSAALAAADSTMIVNDSPATSRYGQQQGSMTPSSPVEIRGRRPGPRQVSLSQISRQELERHLEDRVTESARGSRAPSVQPIPISGSQGQLQQQPRNMSTSRLSARERRGEADDDERSGRTNSSSSSTRSSRRPPSVGGGVVPGHHLLSHSASSSNIILPPQHQHHHHRGRPTTSYSSASSTRASTSRSRSRAPDALSHILGQGGAGRGGSSASSARGSPMLEREEEADEENEGDGSTDAELRRRQRARSSVDGAVEGGGVRGRGKGRFG